MNKQKIVIIGLGGIARRHIQAIFNLKIEYEIIGYDINKESIENTKQFLKNENIHIKNLEMIESYDNTINKIDSKTIVIIATSADVRKQIIEDVISKNPKAIITEKPFTQNIEDYNKIIELSKTNKIPIYLNFRRHYYKLYMQIKSILNTKENVNINIQIKKRGFACTGIHFIELATWLLDAKNYEIQYSETFEPYEQKRKGFFDFSANMIIKFDDMHEVQINFDNEEKEKIEFVEINLKNEIYKIFDFKEKYLVIDNKLNIKEKDFVIMHVSMITDETIMEILENKKPKMPNIEESFLSHKILFEIMKENGLDELNIT
ncbi:Gfo/Idh/MocA family oxidoreductase [archaeon]|jgi:predicted dehydrogenase|nr:Gfo/Idh/MocA family oxidoreductase [archaeon]MBT4352353.1 Gfo/Idh/MocA family oxidoreductase [archaeon]MBT4647052.1 Gfo/Idh/MocA family oxidoreductase [archaeon]MBT6820961.1 Gfo/Idh/MocA family oxidoreductase [archaeon]MBT7392153.1 Gfo/Idh/MocA family oxidoreductase [archaeon]